MNKILQIGFVAAAFMAAIPAQATNFVFNTVNTGVSSGSGIGNSFTYSTGSGASAVNMKVTGWSVAVDGTVSAATLASWGNDGLGIYQQGEKTTAGLHQIDNVNGWEFALLQFDKSVTLTSGVFNPFELTDLGYADNDAFISNATLAGNWNQNLTTGNFSQLISTFKANGINTDSTKFNTNLQTFSMPVGAAGNVWVIGASYNGPDAKNDAFKLAQVSGNTVGAVPEPASWAMMIVGVGMVGGAMRRRKPKVTTNVSLA